MTKNTRKTKAMERRIKKDIIKKTERNHSICTFFLCFWPCNTWQGWQSGKIITKTSLLPIIINPLIPVAEQVLS